MRKYLFLLIISMLILAGCNANVSDVLENQTSNNESSSSIKQTNEYSFFTLNTVHQNVANGEKYYFSDANTYFWNASNSSGEEVLATSGTWEILENKLILREKYKLSLFSGDFSGEINVGDENLVLEEVDRENFKDLKDIKSSNEYMMDENKWKTNGDLKMPWVDILKTMIRKEYLKLNETAINELLVLNDINNIHLFNDNEVRDLGRVKLGEFDYTLNFSSDKDEKILKLHITDEKNDIEVITESDSYVFSKIELTVFKDKYLVVVLNNSNKQDKNSLVYIYDEKLNNLITSAAYCDSDSNNNGVEFFNDRIAYSVYEWIPEDRKKIYNIPREYDLYKVSYEIREEDNKLVNRRVMEDFMDYRKNDIGD